MRIVLYDDSPDDAALEIASCGQWLRDPTGGIHDRYIGTFDMPVCEVLDEDAPGMVEANARLIVEAPELLALARRVRSITTMHDVRKVADYAQEILARIER